MEKGRSYVGLQMIVLHLLAFVVQGESFASDIRTDVKTPHIDKLAAQGVVFDKNSTNCRLILSSKTTSL